MKPSMDLGEYDAETCSEKGTRRARNTGSDGREEMDDILRCFICFGRVRDAHLCPYCSKMCCRDCIIKWLTEEKTQCPHCRKSLQVEQLVKCRFVQDLTKVVDRLHGEINELCNDHQQHMQYFCKQCSVPICSDCAMFENAHCGHEFERLNVVHQRHVKVVKEEVALVQLRIEKLRKVDSEVENNIRIVQATKLARSDELRSMFEDLEASLSAQLHCKLFILLAQKRALIQEINYLESISHDLSYHADANLYPRIELIRKSSALLEKTTKIRTKPFLHCRRNYVSDEFASGVIPEYSSALFRMEHFATLHSTCGVLYSQPLHCNGLTWRLKVYPNGSGVATKVFISVFLELTSGFPGSNKYEYRVQMIHQNDEKHTLTRRFASDFEVGESWGYTKFSRLTTMERDGFVGDDGTVVLKFDVRSPTLLLENREQRCYIEQLERIETERELRIATLERQLREFEADKAETNSSYQVDEIKDDDENVSNVSPSLYSTSFVDVTKQEFDTDISGRDIESENRNHECIDIERDTEQESNSDREEEKGIDPSLDLLLHSSDTDESEDSDTLNDMFKDTVSLQWKTLSAESESNQRPDVFVDIVRYDNALLADRADRHLPIELLQCASHSDRHRTPPWELLRNVTGTIQAQPEITQSSDGYSSQTRSDFDEDECDEDSVDTSSSDGLC